MEINWFIIIIFVVVAIALIVYLIRQNRKDEKEVTDHFNRLGKKTDDDVELNDEK